MPSLVIFETSCVDTFLGPSFHLEVFTWLFPEFFVMKIKFQTLFLCTLKEFVDACKKTERYLCLKKYSIFLGSLGLFVPFSLPIVSQTVLR